jgi:hypothetical protein
LGRFLNKEHKARHRLLIQTENNFAEFSAEKISIPVTQAGTLAEPL